MAVLALTGEKVNVFSSSKNLPAIQEVPITTVHTIWEDTRTSEVWLLIIHEALYFSDCLKESLLCPYQIRAAGNLIKDVPRQFDSESLHSIILSNTLEIPLDMHGVIWHMRTCKPTADELQHYQDGLLKSVELTEDIPWEPYSKEFTDHERTARDARSTKVIHFTIPRPCPQEVPIHMDKVEEESFDEDLFP
jgi:hypothetical protein